MEWQYVAKIRGFSHCLCNRGSDATAGDCAILGVSTTGVVGGALVHVGWRVVVLDLPIADGRHDARMRANVRRSSIIATALKLQSRGPMSRSPPKGLAGLRLLRADSEKGRLQLSRKTKKL